MPGRWRVLALLFAVRTTMAFQFQAVAALAPLMRRELGVSLADIGLLIGLYLAPGIALATPGGAIGKRFGDKSVVIAGLALMVAGGLMMAASQSWGMQLTGRLLAGTGGVLLNVLMSKMVTDWFSGKEIATAMAIFVNSWPIGIALALVVLPSIGAAYGIGAAHLAAVLCVAGGLLALTAIYRAPAAPTAPAASQAGALRPAGRALWALLTAGLIWGLYNAALAMVFGFGGSMLAERGWSPAAASSATSLVLWLAAVSVPLGGLIADRTGRNDAILIVGCLVFAILLAFAARTEAVVPAFIALGLVSGIAAGPIMSLPVRVLPPETRAVGMGIFFTLFYIFVVLAPWVAGHLANAAGTARVTFDFGALMLVACCALTVAFRNVSART
jgi:MFS family permease